MIGNPNKSSIVTFNCFTQEEVRGINEKIKQSQLRKEIPSDASEEVTKKGEFFNLQCHEVMDSIYPFLYRCQQINRSDFGYDIYWQFNIETMNYNVYGVNDGYGWHVDKTLGRDDVKLTCLLNLSEEPYEGGHFHIIGINEPITFTSGEGLCLTSLIGHKVTPITKGKRITLTYWATGPNWR
jgi:hypothetical protein